MHSTSPPVPAPIPSTETATPRGGRPPGRQRRLLRRDAIYIALCVFLPPSHQTRMLAVRLADEKAPVPQFKAGSTPEGIPAGILQYQLGTAAARPEHNLAQWFAGSHSNENKRYSPLDVEFLSNSIPWLLATWGLMPAGITPIAAAQLLELGWPKEIVEKLVQFRDVMRGVYNP